MPKIFAAVLLLMLTATLLFALPRDWHPDPSPDYLLTPYGPNSDCVADSDDDSELTWDYLEPTCNWRLLKTI